MKRASQLGFHIWIILVIIAVIGIIGLLVWRLVASNGGLDGIVNKVTGTSFTSQLACKDRDVKFTSPPMKMEDLGYIRPLGAMLDGHVTPTDHVYVGPVNPDVPDNTYPVLMPADGTVVEVGRMPSEYIGDRNSNFVAPDDNRITMSFSCRYASIYIHIHKLSDVLAKELEGVEPGNNRSVAVELKAGDIVGYIGGNTFDWTPLDGESKLKGYLNPDSYKRESWKIYTVSPFDLYTGDLKTQLEAKSWRTVPPIGGKIDYDEAGKLIGTWFREGTNGYAGSNEERYWDGHLSVVPDYLDPSYTVVSIGNWQDKALQFAVSDHTADPSKVSVKSGAVKYELQPLSYVTADGSDNGRGNTLVHGLHPALDGAHKGTIMFQVLDGEKLKVEKFVGKKASEVMGFTSAAQIYVR